MTGILASVAAGLLSLTGTSALAEDTANIHQVSAEVCQTCHQDIYKQWKGSMHAQSTALTDPLHGAFYQQEAGSPTEEGVLHKKSGKYPVCLSCHAPNAAIDKTTKLDAKPAYAEGVNCVACHTLKSYKGIKDAEGKQQLGLKAYEVAGTLQGPAGFPQGPGQADRRVRSLRRGRRRRCRRLQEAQSPPGRGGGIRGQADPGHAHGVQPVPNEVLRRLHGLPRPARQPPRRTPLPDRQRVPGQRQQRQLPVLPHAHVRRPRRTMPWAAATTRRCSSAPPCSTSPPPRPTAR